MKKLFKIKLFLRSSLSFLRKYLLQNPRYVFIYAWTSLLPNFSFHPHFLKKEEVIDILRNKSFLRIGDGEVHIMLGQGIGFQKEDKRLAEYLKKSVAAYSKESPYVIGINELVMSKTNTYLRSKQALKLWLPMKIFYYLYFPKHLQYIDASIFYYKESFEHLLEDTLKGKEVIVVSRKENISNFSQRAKGIKVRAIETRASDAFDDFDSLVERIKEVALECGHKNCIVLAACGPASKAIVYELSSQMHVIDIGVGLEIAFTQKSLEDIIYL